MKRRNIYIAALIGLMALIMPAIVYASAGDVWVQPQALAVGTSSGFNMCINVDTGASRLAGYVFELTFNPALLQVDTTRGTSSGVSEGKDGFLTAVNTNNTSGLVKFDGIYASGFNPSTNMHLVSVHFKSLAAAGAGSLILNVPDPSTDFIDETATQIGTSSVTNGTITVTAPAPDIALYDPQAPVTDLTFNFYNTSVANTVTQEFTVRNEGNKVLILGSVGAVNTIGADLDIKSDGCSGKSLSPDATCTFRVAWKPSALGAMAGTFTIPSNDPDENPLTVSLIGNGTAVPIAEMNVVDQDFPGNDGMLQFGRVTAGKTRREKITVFNRGIANVLGIGNIAGPGLINAPFSLSSDGCSSATVLTSCVVEIEFAPTAAGVFTNTVTITSDDIDAPAISVVINGVGLSNLTNQAPDAPRLVSPANGATNLDPTVTFTWEQVADPDGDTVSYKIYYDECANFSAMTPIDVASAKPRAGGIAYASMGITASLLGGLFAGLLFGVGRDRAARVLMVLAVAMFLLLACGGGGGGSGVTTPAVDKRIVTLSAGSTYYWKVVAVDGNGATTDSPVYSFSTQ